MATNDDAPVTHVEFGKFTKNLIDTLNEVFQYTFRRFDDLEQRLIRVENQLRDVESRVSSVKKDTEMFPQVFEVLETDGENIARIEFRVSELEKQTTKSD